MTDESFASVAWLVAGIALGMALGIALVCAWRSWARRPAAIPAAAPVQPARAKVTVTAGEVHTVVRRSEETVEGLEILYGRQNLVRSVRVGAMNSEHKELLLTMDAVQWETLTNAGKQEVLAAARSTWASKMCPSGPDIAYVIVQTDNGRVVGRADPRCVTIV